MKILRDLDEIKKTEKPLDWWTTFFIYKLSSPLVSLIKDTAITPNHLTLISLLLVILASFMIALGNYPLLLMAAALLQLGFIFDNADGQLARYKKISSAFGHWLDSSCDRICELFIIASLTFRFSQVNDKALFFGFYALFLIYYYQGRELENLSLVCKGKKEAETSSKASFKDRFRWIPFNSGEQYFLFSLFLLLNRIDLFFYFFISYGTVFLISFHIYKYHQYTANRK